MRPKYLVRVDDFPAVPMNIDRFVDFHEAMAGLPYLLAVTPRICRSYYTDMDSRSCRNLSAEELSVLKKVARHGVSFGVHGLDHKTISRKHHTEFAGLGRKEVDDKIRESLRLFKKIGKTEVFVPPFNSFDLSNLQVFRKYFSIITGGPETRRTFGNMPAGNLDGMIYVPSYRPFYGRAREVCAAVRKDRTEKIKCLALHWTWESDLAPVRKLANMLQGKVMSWNSSTLRTALLPAG